MASKEVPPGMAQLGEFIRAQRKMMEMSQRELAKLSDLSDPYVSQIERGLHEPSIRVLRAMAEALNVRAETLLSFAGIFESIDVAPVEESVQADPHLSASQKQALIGVYRGFLATAEPADTGDSEE